MNECNLHLCSGDVMLPAFFPDATYGSVRCVDASDLADCGVRGVVMNTYHLMSKPGLGVIRHFGGARRFSGWNGPILTDSGGFQVFSMIRENPKYGEVRKNEIIFRPKGADKLCLTPEKCIDAQFAISADILMCLDYCNHPEDSYELTETSVNITIDWAKKCKREYERQLKMRKLTSDSRPLIFAIIQGGGYRELRRRCAEALADIGFDGYGFGGWPLSSDMTLIEDILDYTAKLMPDNSVKYAMGIGKPDNVIKCAGMGYNLFDCVIPSRDARHNRLYVFTDGGLGYAQYYILDNDHIRDNRPVSETCGCLLCRNYPRAYLYNLAKTGDPLAPRLATIHNLRFYTDLLERIRAGSTGTAVENDDS